MRDLIFVSLEDWDEIWRRNQFVCAKLIERNPKLKILFVQPALDVSYALRTGQTGRLFQRRAQTGAVDGRIVRTRALKLLPNSWSWARKFNEWILRRHIRFASRRLGFRSPILWLNDHRAVHMVDGMGECSVIYDITDDWSEFTQSAALRALTIAQDSELCRRADAVIVCSEELLKKKQSLARNLHLVKNGVDAAHYECVLDATGPLPPEADAWQKPVFGYTGSIHPDRVDVDLVEKIARAFPSGTVALIGPMMLSADDQAMLRACGNVVMTGPVAYARLPELMRAFDVCITPHRVTPFTESLNPIKLWEYLAAGKPIVSTDVAGFRDYPEHVRIAKDHDAFIEELGEALGNDAGKSNARRIEARAHSWDVRVKQIEYILHAATKNPGFPIGAGKPGALGPLISAIVVSYNTRELTLECLRALDADLSGIDSEIILVDNASEDGSVDAIRAAFPQVRMIVNATNAGFGAANNQAINDARGEFFFLLNSDAFPKRGAIRSLLNYLIAHPEVGVVGPRLLNADGSLQVSCHRFPSPGRAWIENTWLSAALPMDPRFGDYRKWPHDTERRVEWIVGACMLVRRKAVEEVGGFDPLFFMYAEETDWQRRLCDYGWEIGFTPTAEVTHLGGASGAPERARINRHFFDSLDRYELKHHGIAGLISLRCAMTIGCGLRALLWAITWLIRPNQRSLAASKTRLHAWLFVRQAMHWKTPR